MLAQDRAIEIKHEANNLVETGQAESDRMGELLRELMEIIASGRSVAVARAVLNRVSTQIAAA